MNVNISARVESVVDPEMFLLNGRRQERLVGLNKGKNLRMGNSLSSVWIILSFISSLAIFLCLTFTHCRALSATLSHYINIKDQNLSSLVPKVFFIRVLQVTSFPIPSFSTM